MTNKRTQESIDRRDAKRAAVLGPERKSRLPLVVCLSLIVAAPVGAYFILHTADRGAAIATGAASSPAAQAPAADRGALSYPVAQFDDGKAHYFSHNDPVSGTEIRFFVLKSSDGIVRAAFDACDVCWPANKGYAQEGDAMVCRNCGRRFASVKINEVKGGCNPAPLKRAIVGDRLVVQVSDILEGKPYFNIKGKV
jgi:uncharacterized membrane protein